MLRTSSIFAVVLVGSGVVAQTGPWVMQPTRVVNRLFPNTTPYTAGSIHRARILDGDGASSPDVAMLIGTSIKIALNPDVWANFADSSGAAGTGDVADFAVADCSHLPTLNDGLFVTSAVGGPLRAIWYVTGTGTPSWGVRGLNGWNDIRRIEADKTPTNSYRLAGVTAAGDTLKIGAWSLGGFVTTAATVTLGTIHDIAYVDWNNDGTRDVIAVHSNGGTHTVEAFDATTGVSIGTKTILHADAAYLGRGVAGTIDEVICVSEDAGASEWSIHRITNGALLSTTLVDPSPLAYSSLSIIGISLGDYDGDGYRDLLLSNNSTSPSGTSGGNYQLIYRYQSEKPVDVFDNEWCYGIRCNAMSNAANATPGILGDINNDFAYRDDAPIGALADFVQPVDTLDKLKIVLELRHAELQLPNPVGVNQAPSVQVHPVTEGLTDGDGSDYVEVIYTDDVDPWIRGSTGGYEPIPLGGGAGVERKIRMQLEPPMEWGDDVQGAQIFVARYRDTPGGGFGQIEAFYSHEIHLNGGELIPVAGGTRHIFETDVPVGTGEWSEYDVYLTAVTFLMNPATGHTQSPSVMNAFAFAFETTVGATQSSINQEGAELLYDRLMFTFADPGDPRFWPCPIINCYVGAIRKDHIDPPTTPI